MKTLFKRDDVIKFLYTWDCNMTAEDIKSKSSNAEFLDSGYVKNFLIEEIYTALTQTINQYTYKQ